MELKSRNENEKPSEFICKAEAVCHFLKYCHWVQGDLRAADPLTFPAHASLPGPHSEAATLTAIGKARPQMPV